MRPTKAINIKYRLDTSSSDNRTEKLKARVEWKKKKNKKQEQTQTKSENTLAARGWSLMCGQLDVCVMYVNIFQVFCLFSITSGGCDWLCCVSGWQRYVCCLLPPPPSFHSTSFEGFDFAQQIKLIAFRIHLKQNENAQSLLVSHISNLSTRIKACVPSGNVIKVQELLLLRYERAQYGNMDHSGQIHQTLEWKYWCLFKSSHKHKY